LLVGKLEFKEHNYMFNSYEMELYSAGGELTRLRILPRDPRVMKVVVFGQI
jgi:hypothetical protein